MSRLRRGNRSAVVRSLLLVALWPTLVLSCASSAESASQGQAVPPVAPLLPALPALPVPEPVSSLTGLATDLDAPALCVKIDNSPEARPQSGLELADLVYLEPVEGGLSRLLAVYQSRIPPVVGPVRSVRHSDLELLANFGRPALAFSGEAPELRPLVDQAPVLDVSILTRPGAYHRDHSRPMPHNLYADAAQLREGGVPPRDIGFRFGPTPPGGQPLADTVIQYGATQIGVRWLSDEASWVVTMDGAPLTAASGARLGAPTVVLQQVALQATNIRDAAGSPSPFAVTVGAGEAVVLRDGQAFAGQWSRPAPELGTTFTLPDGVPLAFTPGPVWVILVPV